MHSIRLLISLRLICQSGTVFFKPSLSSVLRHQNTTSKRSRNEKLLRAWLIKNESVTNHRASGRAIGKVKGHGLLHVCSELGARAVVVLGYSSMLHKHVVYLRVRFEPISWLKSIYMITKRVPWPTNKKSNLQLELGATYTTMELSDRVTVFGTLISNFIRWYR